MYFACFDCYFHILFCLPKGSNQILSHFETTTRQTYWPLPHPLALHIARSFPQRNGDVFAFTPELNEVFMHGVPHVMPNSPAAKEEEVGVGGEMGCDGPPVASTLW